MVSCSGGDLVTGAATAVEAIAAGRKRPTRSNRYIVTGKAEPEPFEFTSRKDSFAKVTPVDLRSIRKAHAQANAAHPPR